MCAFLSIFVLNCCLNSCLDFSSLHFTLTSISPFFVLVIFPIIIPSCVDFRFNVFNYICIRQHGFISIVFSFSFSHLLFRVMPFPCIMFCLYYWFRLCFCLLNRSAHFFHFHLERYSLFLYYIVLKVDLVSRRFILPDAWCRENCHCFWSFGCNPNSHLEEKNNPKIYLKTEEELVKLICLYKAFESTKKISHTTKAINYHIEIRIIVKEKGSRLWLWR